MSAHNVFFVQSPLPEGEGAGPLERGAETQLEHARLVSEIVAERGLAKARIVFVLCIATVVGVIEQIERLEHAEELYAVTDSEPLLKPHVHAMIRRPHKAVARYDRSIPSKVLQNDRVSSRFVAKVGTVENPVTLA